MSESYLMKQINKVKMGAKCLLVIMAFKCFYFKKNQVNKYNTFNIKIALLDILKLSYIDKDINRYAYNLILRYDFQFSDSVIVANAKLNNCTILY